MKLKTRVRLLLLANFTRYSMYARTHSDSISLLIIVKLYFSFLYFIIFSVLMKSYSYFLGVSRRDPACLIVSDCVSCINATYSSGIPGHGGTHLDI